MRKIFYAEHPPQVNLETGAVITVKTLVDRSNFEIGHEEAERFANTKFEFRWG